MNKTCKIFWDDEKHCLAVQFIDEGRCVVGLAYYRDTDPLEPLGIDAANWVANNGIMSWPGWKESVVPEECTCRADFSDGTAFCQNCGGKVKS